MSNSVSLRSRWSRKAAGSTEPRARIRRQSPPDRRWRRHVRRASPDDPLHARTRSPSACCRRSGSRIAVGRSSPCVAQKDARSWSPSRNASARRSSVVISRTSASSRARRVEAIDFTKPVPPNPDDPTLGAAHLIGWQLRARCARGSSVQRASAGAGERQTLRAGPGIELEHPDPAASRSTRTAHAGTHREREDERGQGENEEEDERVDSNDVVQVIEQTRLAGIGSNGKASLPASSAESVGEFWFGQVAKCMI